MGQRPEFGRHPRQGYEDVLPKRYIFRVQVQQRLAPCQGYTKFQVGYEASGPKRTKVSADELHQKRHGALRDESLAHKCLESCPVGIKVTKMSGKEMTNESQASTVCTLMLVSSSFLVQFSILVSHLFFLISWRLLLRSVSKTYPLDQFAHFLLFFHFFCLQHPLCEFILFLAHLTTNLRI